MILGLSDFSVFLLYFLYHLTILILYNILHTHLLTSFCPPYITIACQSSMCLYMHDHDDTQATLLPCRHKIWDD